MPSGLASLDAAAYPWPRPEKETALTPLLFIALLAPELTVVDLVVAEDVQRREPVGVGQRFETGQKIVAHLRARNTGQPVEVRLRWSRDGVTRADTPMKIGSAHQWRTWSRFTLSAGDEGPWQVALVGPDGATLARAPFVVGQGEVPAVEPVRKAPRADAPPPLSPEPEPEPPRFAPAIEPEPVPAKARPERCRAWVNFPVGEGHAVVEVDVDAGTARHTRGLAIIDGRAGYALRLVGHHESHVNEHGAVAHRWDELRGTRLSADGFGTLRKWHGYPATLPPPSPPARGQLYEVNRLRVLATIGPYVSLRAKLKGNAGGEHGFDNSRYAMIAAPGSGMNPANFVDGPLRPLLQARIETLRPSGDNPPDAEKHDLRRSALVPVGSMVSLRTLMPCCSWGENRGLLEVDVPIQPAPPRLGPHLPGADGFFRSSCGAVGWRRGALYAAAEGERPKRLSLTGLKPAGPPLGAYWLADDLDFGFRQLRLAWRALGADAAQ